MRFSITLICSISFWYYDFWNWNLLRDNKRFVVWPIVCCRQRGRKNDVSTNASNGSETGADAFHFLFPINGRFFSYSCLFTIINEILRSKLYALTYTHSYINVYLYSLFFFFIFYSSVYKKAHAYIFCLNLLKEIRRHVLIFNFP